VPDDDEDGAGDGYESPELADASGQAAADQALGNCVTPPLGNGAARLSRAPAVDSSVGAS
jgi:hypothetical protein